MERNVLLTVTLICIIVAGVGGQSPASSPTKSPDAPSTPTTSPSSPPVEAPKSPSPVTSSPPPAPVPESAPPSPPPKASAPVRSPPASVPEAATPPAPVADAPAPSKGKKHQNATAPAPELDSPPSPPMEAPGPSSDTVSPGPATSANEKASVIQGFISYGRIETYLPHMKAGCTYRLNKFYGSKSKSVYRIADSDVTISFSWNSALTALEDSSICFPEDRIRIHGFREFDGASDLKGDLYDYIGHIKLVNGKVPTDSILLDEGEIAVSRRVELHVQTHDDPVMKLYLWDKAAFEFIDKFKASRGTARVILVTTLNPKRFGGVLSLSAMASSRVFMDSDIQETLSYLSWLNSNLDVASRVNAEVITKPEPATLGELFAYMNQASSKVAWFECTATIDDVVHGSGWYYIGCGVCHTKATKGPTTLMCKKCGKSEIVGVAQYLTRLSVYDNNDQAVFVVLGDAGEELTGKKASELVEKYYQVNDNIEGDHKVPVPQAMIDTIGQTRKFIVKVSKHNLDAKTQTLTVTKVLPPDAAGPEDNLEGDVDVIGDAEGVGNAAEFGKRGADEIESEGVKRAKCG